MLTPNSKQEVDLENLKNLLNQPRYYLSEYFKDLRTEVDIAFVKKGLNEANSNQELKEKIKENWIEMINKIDSFENECIQALGSNSFSKKIQDETNQQIDVIQSKLNENLSDLNEINYLIYDQVQKLEKILFQNKFMIFLLKTQCIYTKNICAKLDIATGVGKLIFITNEYLGRLSIYNLKKNQMNFSLTKERLTNEVLKLMKLNEKLTLGVSKNQIMECSLDLNTWNTIVLAKEKTKKIDKHTFSGLINLASLRLNSNLIEEIDKDLFTGLPSLACICLSSNQLKSIDADLFKDLHNLKEIWLNYNKLESIDKNQFRGLKNLTIIRLECNNISDIDSNTFNGLTNLKLLSLAKNNLKEIHKDTFKGLTSLEDINLSKNEIKSLESELFKDLKNLNNIDLNSNQLEHLDKSIFCNSTNLTSIDLGNNKLTSIDKDLFANLSKLALIELGVNQLETIDKSVFKGLVSLTEIYLSNNKLSELDKDIFNGLVSLKIIFLKNNQLKQIDKFIFKDLKLLYRINMINNLFINSESLELALESNVKYVMFRNSDETNDIESLVNALHI